MMKPPNCVIAAVAFLTMATGCASTFHQTPFIMYADEDRPLSDTAVFSALDQRQISESRVTHVDGAATSCVKAGCPYWVRVTPGRHVFTVSHVLPERPAVRYTRVELVIEDMKPRHVYRAQYLIKDPRGFDVSIEYEDLGENPNYSIPLYADSNVSRVRF